MSTTNFSNYEESAQSTPSVEIPRSQEHSQQSQSAIDLSTQPMAQLAGQDFMAPLPIPNPPSATSQTSSSPPRTLWMGDLDPWSDEEAIVKLWESLGKRVLVKVIKAKRGTPAATLNTGHAGYCFVEFESYDDAKSVLALNGSQIPNTNRLFRLNWASGATLSSPIPQSPEYSLFVGDLSPSTTEAHLLALFQTHFKSVKTVRVMTDPITGTSRCFGFVRFSDEEERRRALTEMSGVWCAGRPLRVALATPRAQGNSQGLVQPGVIGGSFPGQQFQPFPGQQAPQQQNDMMMFQYQQVPPPSIPYYPAEAQQQQQQQQQQHQQQQHQQHQQHPQAQQEMTALQSAQSSGNGIPPMQSMPYSDPNNTTVFVGGLAAGASEQTLAALFQPFGPIAHIKIPPNKGCGFIRFENREDAMNAINAMQGFSIGGSRIRLSWGRQQNQQRLQMAMAAAMQGGPLPIQQGGPTIAPPVSSTGFSQPMMAPVNSMYYLATDQKFAYDGSPFPSIGNEQQYLQAMEYEEKENDKEQGRDGTPDNDGVTKLQEMYNAAVAGKLDSLN